jgi:hypothetical protein
MATAEIRWGVIPLVDGSELLRGQGESAQSGKPMTLEYQLVPTSPDSHVKAWRHELQVEGEDPMIWFPAIFGRVMDDSYGVPEHKREWAIRQEVRYLDELATAIRELLLSGLYVTAAELMVTFGRHMRDLSPETLERDEDVATADRLLNSREARTIPLDDHSHGPAIVAEIESLDGRVIVEGAREGDAEPSPIVVVKDHEAYPDGFQIRCVTEDQADALWVAVYGARVAVWGEPTPFTSRS